MQNSAVNVHIKMSRTQNNSVLNWTDLKKWKLLKFAEFVWFYPMWLILL